MCVREIENLEKKMKRLLVFLKDYKKETVLGPLFKLLEASFELIVPLVVASIIDVGIANTDRPYIYKMCGVLVLLAAVGLASSVTAQYFAAKAAVGFSTKLRYALFEHIGELSFTEMDHVGTSTLITRMTSDVNQVQSGVNMTLRLFLRSPFIVFGAMIMAFTVDVKAALVFVVTIPLLSIVVFGVMLLCMPRFKKVQQGLDAILGRTRENLAGARVIRAFNKEEEEVVSFGEENERLTNMQLLVGRISALTNPLTYIIINAAIIAVIWIGGNRVYGGYITQGAVVALVNYMSQILVELVKLANLIVNITKSLACANRIAEVLALESSLKEPGADEGATGTGRLESAAGIAQSSAIGRTDLGVAAGDAADGIRVRFDHVSMIYSGASEEALKDIDFCAKAGQTIGIIGGTGSGKSSLVHLIPRFYDVSAGAVYVDGKDVRDYSLTALRDKVGMVMQKAVLFSGTIAENLRWGNENATEEEMWHALDIAQATDVVKSKKDGLASKIEEGGKNLSGGQKQRLTIARAVVKTPDILILDDSASALDFATDAKLRAALRRLQAEGSMTVFIVSQRTSSIRFADQIIVLDDGIAVGIGTHDELLQNCEIYREIYDSQFKKEGGSHAE
jgi:ABC-type multidrug transport system fused ATPase/permease subunit